MIYFTLFDTALGACGIAWGERGIVGTQLPEATRGAARARLLRRFPGADEGPSPPEVREAIDGVVALLRGEPSDLSGAVLDMDAVPAFQQRVYEVTRAIPRGATLTYGEIASRLGAPETARDVGQALAQNPFAPIVPCHRVLGAGGKLGGFSARGGTATKLRLLALERSNGPLFE